MTPIDSSYLHQKIITDKIGLIQKLLVFEVKGAFSVFNLDSRSPGENEFAGGDKVCGQSGPSGVQGQSPDRWSGGRSPPEVDGFVVNKHPKINHFYVIKRNLNKNI